jgi:hypothetical protein
LEARARARDRDRVGARVTARVRVRVGVGGGVRVIGPVLLLGWSVPPLADIQPAEVSPST